MDAHGDPDPEADVVELTGILGRSHGGDQMLSRPKEDVRVIARRVPRPSGEQAKLGEDPNWRYGAFATNTTAGQIQWLDARHRTQAHVEDKVKELKAVGAENPPSKDWDRNSAWLQLAALAASLNAWLRHLALDGQLARAEPKALRYRLLGAPAATSPPPASES
ncbi:MAG: transposase [Actinomycetes bacterium]